VDTLTSIKVFRQVVESGSFVGAAERLDLSTAMVSKHVMNAEKRLDLRLLNRNGRDGGRSRSQSCEDPRRAKAKRGGRCERWEWSLLGAVPALKHTARPRRPARGGGIPDVGNDVAIARRAAEQHVRSLRVVLDILIVCDMALRMQGAEMDQEIAEVLRYCGSYRLGKVIEEMEGSRQGKPGRRGCYVSS
jgi:Bacterial regulatory helix-turn-helix protein, lysR family